MSHSVEGLTHETSRRHETHHGGKTARCSPAHQGIDPFHIPLLHQPRQPSPARTTHRADPPGSASTHWHARRTHQGRRSARWRRWKRDHARRRSQSALQSWQPSRSAARSVRSRRSDSTSRTGGGLVVNDAGQVLRRLSAEALPVKFMAATITGRRHVLCLGAPLPTEVQVEARGRRLLLGNVITAHQAAIKFAHEHAGRTAAVSRASSARRGGTIDVVAGAGKNAHTRRSNGRKSSPLRLSFFLCRMIENKITCDGDFCFGKIIGNKNTLLITVSVSYYF